MRSFKIGIQTLIDCTGYKTKRILVKPKIFKYVYDYLSNESENSNFHSGKQNLWPNEFQKGRYGIYIAREIGHFANDLRIRRNHFCWIRDVKLLLGFKFHNC